MTLVRLLRRGRWPLATLLVAVLVGLGVGLASSTTNDDRARPAPALVWAIGDGGTGGKPPKQVAAMVARDRPDRVLYLGDVYETGTAKEFEVNFAGVYGRLVGRMWPTPGNHEWARHAKGYDRFWRGVRGKRLPHFYANDVGGWRLLSANSQDPGNPGQLRWLREQVAGADSDCLIAFWHRPRFNAGRHGDEEAAVAPLWDAVKGRVPIVLSGHDHNFQRFKPVDGTVQYVSGAGGKERYVVDDADPRLAFSDDETFGGLRIRLFPGEAELTFVSADGSTLDTSTVSCGP